MVTATFKTFRPACHYLWETKGLAWPVGIVGAMWYGFVKWIQEVIRDRREHIPPPTDGTHRTELWELMCFVLPGLLTFTAFLFRVRGIEIFFFLVFCLVFPIALPLAVIWDVITIAFLGTQYVLLAVGSYSSHLMLLVYFLGYYLFLWIKPPGLFAYRAILSQSSNFFVIRLPRYQINDARNHDRLCSTCQDLVRNSRILLGTKVGFTWPRERHPHHTPTGLENSARDCHLCSLLFQSIDKNNLPLYTSKPTQYGAITPAEVQLKLRIWDQKSTAGATFIWAQIDEKGLCDRPVLIEQISRGSINRPQYSNEGTQSDAVMAWAKEQIQKCCAEHSICRNYFVPMHQRQYRPTRLIDVNSTSIVRLVDTSELPTSIKLEYIAFSHCWGEREIGYKLCKDTMGEMTSSIPVETLAQNFQHAMYITRKLGVRYLWLDSLCIFQDSEEDWVKESKTMGLLYANALCTVSATASPDAHIGCFSQQKPLLGDCILRQDDKTSLVASFSGHEGSSLAYLFQSKVESAAVTKRGWTFQERVLASRVLHFCDGVVLFECNALQSSSCHSTSRTYPRNPHNQIGGRAVVRLGPAPPPRPPRPSWPLPELGASGSSEGFLTVTWEYITIRNWFNNHPLTRPHRNYIRTAIPMWEINEAYEVRSYSVESYYNFTKTYQDFKKFFLWSPQREQVVDMSARIGMRGAFELLPSFKGTTLLEKLQFHNAWYDLVEPYSVRKLSYPDKDKVFAIDGIAYFIHVNTGFDFQSGVWANQIPLTLFWMRGGELERRPIRKTPTWTWASIDGKITNPLKSHQDSKRTNAHSIDLLCESISVTADKYLRIHRTRVMELDINDVNLVADVVDIPNQTRLLCIPLLLIRIRSGWRSKCMTQIHGFVVRIERHTPLPPGGHFVDQQYERVGYFWSELGWVVDDVVKNLQKRWMVVSII